MSTHTGNQQLSRESSTSGSRTSGSIQAGGGANQGSSAAAEYASDLKKARAAQTDWSQYNEQGPIS